jgi:thiol-disulfide isomerase/thioredoxin
MCGKIPEKFLYQALYPQPGHEMNISYFPSGTILGDANEITLVTYCYSQGITNIKEVEMIKSKDIWHSSFTIPDSTVALYIIFKSDVQQDDNDKNAYEIPLFTADKKPVKGRMSRQAEIAYYGGPYPSLPRDWGKAKYFLNKEFELYPEEAQNREIVNAYWYPFDNLHRDSACQIISVQLKKLGQKKEKTINELSLLVNWYEEWNEKALAEIYENELFNRTQKEKYGEFERYHECAREKSMDRKRNLILNFMEDYPHSAYIDQLHDRMISAYKSKGLYTEAESYFDTYVQDSATRFLDDLSWAIIKGEIFLEIFVDFAEIAVEKARKELIAKEKPDHFTQKEWQEYQNQNLVDALDTYGYGLYTLGKIEEAVPVFEEAVELDQRENKIIHESYCRSLYKTGQIGKAFTELEFLVMRDPWNQELDSLFEEVYFKRKGSKEGLEAFFYKAQNVYRKKKQEEIREQMIENPAPLFTLYDLDSNYVRLTDFKGKIVILDFWATWCGPCILWFPTMQKLVEKYGDDDRIKFLFINTFERRENVINRAKDLISGNNYTFHVLFDVDSCSASSVSSAYKLSGIPEIFIIDPEGNIRFRPCHSGLNDMEFIEQLDIMIDMLR